MLHTLSGKVTLTIILYIGLLISIATSTIYAAQAMEAETKQLAEITLVEATLNETLIFRLARANTEIVSAAALLDDEELEQARENLAEARAILGELTALETLQLSPDLGELDGQRLALIERLEQTTEQIAAAVAEGDRQAATATLEDLEPIDAMMEELIATQDAMLERDAEQTLTAVTDRAAQISRWAPLQYTLIGLLAVLAAWLLHRIVVRPVRALAQVATAVGAGSLEQVVVPSDGIDEVGALQRAFGRMVEGLRERDRALAAQIQTTQRALAEVEQRSSEQSRLVEALEQQREAVRGLSVPVLPISDRVLVMPLVGSLDSERQRLVQTQALQAISETRARTLILDVTGVPVIDEEVARGLFGVIQASRLLGARVVLVGIRPEVAQALVGLDLPLTTVRSLSSLQAGIEEALRYEREAAGPRLRSAR